MKIFVFFLSLNVMCFSQTYKLGGSLNFAALPNKEMKLQFGPSINFTVTDKHIPVFFLTCIRYFIGEGPTWTSTKSLGIGAAYTLKKDSRVVPYFGLCFFINDYTLNSQGFTGRAEHISSLPINISPEIAAGLNLNSQNEKSQILLEISYSYNKPKYKYYLIRYDQNDILEGNLNYSTVYFRFGFLFKI